MLPIEFEGQNVIYGKDQKEYLPLPAYVSNDGIATSCWEFTDEEIETLVKTKRMYISQMTFNQPLMPVLPQVQWEVHKPEEKATEPPAEMKKVD